MFRMGRRYQLCLAGCVLLVALVGNAVGASALPSDSPAALLKQADKLRTSDYTESAAIVQRLGDGSIALSPEEKLYLLYLRAWQAAYRGNYEAAIPMLEMVVRDSTDPNLRFRAGITAVNMLGIGHHYQAAFSQLDLLLNQLPKVTDNAARLQGLVVASQLYIEAGQYDLAGSYADQLLKEISTNEGVCKGSYLKIYALSRSGAARMIDADFKGGINACIKAGDSLWANGVRSNLASFEIQHGEVESALKLLRKNYSDVQHTRYVPLIARFNALLAQAYWMESEFAQAKRFALDAVQGDVKNEYTESLTTAYKLLYLIAQKQRDFQAALAYHEKYMAADKGYLNEVSAKALAYQTVKQQVLAKKLQIDALDKRNRILQLQRALDKKAIETTRLYIILLLTVLAFIAFVAVRIKRSQLRFMRMARRDGLTGLFNRQYFLDEAQRQLQYCRKSARDACLVLIDLDHFKNINDTHGHVVGDEVLKRAVIACQAHLRSTDIFGRLGGEEFGILLPECTLERVSARVEQLRLAIAETPAGDALCVPVSASFGVATTACSGYELRQLLIHADDALYQAKNSGRNRAIVFDADSLRQAGMRKSRVGTPVAEPNA